MPSGWTVYVAGCAAGVMGGALAAMATSGPSTFGLIALVAAAALLAAIAFAQLRGRPRAVVDGDDDASDELTRGAAVAAAPPVEAPDAVPVAPSMESDDDAREDVVPAAPVVESPPATMTETLPLDGDDWDGLTAICGAISGTQLAWMRAETFSRPWFDERVRPFVALEPAVADLRGRPFSVELRARLDSFADALGTFAAFYGDNTFPDPLLSASDWRFFDWTELTDSAPGASTDGLWNVRAAQMQGLARKLADACEAARDTATAELEAREGVTVGTQARLFLRVLRAFGEAPLIEDLCDLQENR